jgi:thiamine pyrophosphate-dependent acetolactate synthase large subunit-like protein
MADGHAWATGSVGVALISRGPGFTNAYTALVTAKKAHSKLLVICGESSTSARPEADSKWLDHAGVAAAAGVSYFDGFDPHQVVTVLREAYAAAAAANPAVLSIPVDVLEKLTRTRAVTVRDPTVPAPHASGVELETALRFLLDSQHPLILVGRGAVAAGAVDVLASLAEKSGALLGTTMFAKDAFRGHRRNVGVVGGFSSQMGRKALDPVDCVLAFGASLNARQLAYGALFQKAVVVQFDVDAEAGKRAGRADLLVLADARDAATSLLTEISKGDARVRDEDTALLELLARPSIFDHVDESTADGIDPRTLVTALDRVLPSNRSVVTDGGHFQGWPSMAMTVPSPERFRMTTEFSSIGLGLGTALGIALGQPETTTVLFVGDGGLAMTLGDLATIARYKPPLLVVVMNDQAYGAERHFLDLDGIPHEHALFPDIAFADVAESLGLQAFTIRSLSALDQHATLLANPPLPLLLDCKINPSIRGPWLEEGWRASKSLTDTP